MREFKPGDVFVDTNGTIWLAEQNPYAPSGAIRLFSEVTIPDSEYPYYLISAGKNIIKIGVL